MPPGCLDTDPRGTRADAKRVADGSVHGTNNSAHWYTSATPQSHHGVGQGWGVAGQYIPSPISMPVAFFVGIVMVMLLIFGMRKFGVGLGTRIRHD